MGHQWPRRLLLLCILTEAPLASSSFHLPSPKSQLASKATTASAPLALPPFHIPKTARAASSNDKDNQEQTEPPTLSAVEMTVTAVGKTTSALVALVFFSVLAWKRDTFMLAFFIGSVSNGVLSKVFKKLLNQSRPQALQLREMKLKPSDGGMPSSHAMSLGFIATFTTTALLALLDNSYTTATSHTTISSSSPTIFIMTITAATLMWLYVAVSLAYRVQAHLHTWQQVAAGLIVGASNGALWWNVFQAPTQEWLLSAHVVPASTGVLPWPALAIPALVGAVVVGSLERRVSEWLQTAKASKKEQ